MAELDANELYMLSLINRARQDPAGAAAAYGIDLNQGLADGTISTDAKQVLAPNNLLHDAADAHSAWMLDTDSFAHIGANGSDGGGRIAAAGYNATAWGENISWQGTLGDIDDKDVPIYIELQQKSLFLNPDHRAILLNGSFTEAGIGQVEDDFAGYRASMITQDFAASGEAKFFTGIVFDDKDGDGFYDPGEGIGGVEINIDGKVVAKTSDAGGYSIAMTDGTRVVTFSGDGVDGGYSQIITMDGQNLGLDVKAEQFASVHFQSWNGELGGWVPVTPQKYIGPVAGLDWQHIGTAADEIVIGSDENDFINLGAGNDAINAGKGDDVIDGGAGSNFLTGGEGYDVFFADARNAQGNWSTLTDFQVGEQVSIWGWEKGVSRMSWVESAGAEGHQGTTVHVDLNGDGNIETSVTFAGHAIGTVGTAHELDGVLWIA